jgi:hypothetical protein
VVPAAGNVCGHSRTCQRLTSFFTDYEVSLKVIFQFVGYVSDRKRLAQSLLVYLRLSRFSTSAQRITN